MERKEFLKRLGLSTIVSPIIIGCSNDDHSSDVDSSDGTCTTTPSETAGPFPTKVPSSLVMEDIVSDRTGVTMTIEITIQNKNNNCNSLADALVDIWHCDKDGYYSEYGGSGMQSVNLTSVHFLRGRQTSNANGVVGFKTIFPGWYSGRAPHIHVHVYDGSGKSLLVTQIAFPSQVCDTVYTTATQYYTHGKQDTSNNSDNVFSDGVELELAILTGNITDGYQLKKTIIVEA